MCVVNVRQVTQTSVGLLMKKAMLVLKYEQDPDFLEVL